MKKTCTLVVLLALMQAVQGQTWEEWTQQRKTQIKYLVDQIAALQMYFGYAKKGYEAIDKGLQLIQDIKKGDLNLHKEFFSSLKEVNPLVERSGKVTDIIAIQVRITKEANEAMKSISESKQFTKKELDYLCDVFERILQQCIKDMDELLLVITPGELQMKDDERLKRINKLHQEMLDKYVFCKSFSKEAALLALQRRSEKNGVSQLKQVYGLAVTP